MVVLWDAHREYELRRAAQERAKKAEEALEVAMNEVDDLEDKLSISESEKAELHDELMATQRAHLQDIGKKEEAMKALRQAATYFSPQYFPITATEDNCPALAAWNQVQRVLSPRGER